MAARFQLGQKRRQAQRWLGLGHEGAEKLLPRRADQPDLPVEDLGVAHTVGLSLGLEGPPGVTDEALQDYLVALVGRERAVVIKKGEHIASVQ